ncbi:hypothetical protein L1887_62200 [Cichorium endivia]|nr:hypothetical protein L1887_62200 [Cichorium endivia]
MGAGDASRRMWNGDSRSPIDSGRGPVRIGAAAKSRAVDRLVEMPSRRSWFGSTRRLGDIPACTRHPACGHPIRPILKHGPRSLTCVRVNGIAGARVRDGAAASLSRATESRAPSGPFLVSRTGRCGDEPEAGLRAKLRANLEPTKGVGRLRQQDGGHGNSAFRSRASKGIGVKFLNRDVAADGNVRESGDVGGGLGKSYLFCLTACPPLETTQSEGRVQRLQGKSAKWIRNLGKRIGSEGLGTGEVPSPEPVGCRRTARAASAARAGRRVPGRGTDWERLLRGPSPGVEQANSELRGNAPLLDPRPASAGRSGRKTLSGGCLAGAAHLLKDNAAEFTKCWIVHPPIGNVELGLDRRETESGLEATRVPTACLPTSSRGLGPQRHVSLAKPVRRMSRAGRHEVQFPSSGG